ncbi:MAG TPA: FtsX-like permease family protein [Dehalococcoidia bacterium]|nr:FtsX-like permease family protein [Dehalococcoidia bacterium]
MLRALFRKVWADTAGRPLQAGLVFIVVTIATGVLTVAVTTQVSVDSAYLTRFEEGNGAHVWFSYPFGEGSPADLAQISELEGVVATSGLIPYLTESFPLILDDRAVNLKFIGMPSVPPDVGSPIMISGRWLSSDGDREIVLDYGLARNQGIEIGDRLEVLIGDKSETFEVVGLSVAADRLSYPYVSEATAYVLPAVLEIIEENPDEWRWQYGVQVQDQEAAGVFARAAWETYPDNQKPTFVTWKYFRDEVNDVVRLYYVFIGAFGIFAVCVAAFVIVNVVAGNVLAQFRDIALLKSVGFTPRQLTSLILLEHVSLGLLAAVVGAAIGYAAAPLALRVTEDPLGMAVSPVFDPLMIIAIVLGTSLIIAVTALVPAWRGGKVPIVQALTTGSPQLQSNSSRAVKWATLLKLPTIMVIGFKDAFHRPMRSTLTILALILAVILAAFGLGMEATLRDIIEDPTLAGGEPYEITVGRNLEEGSMTADEVATLLDSQPEIQSYYEGRALVGSVVIAGHVGKKYLFGAPGSSYANLAPYIPEGRLFNKPGEAILTRKMADETGLSIGDSFTLVLDGELSGDMEIDGGELTLQVVGIYVDDTAQARISSETLMQQLNLDLEPTHYRVKVVPGTDPETSKITLLNQANNQLSITVIDDYEANKKTAGYVRPPLYALTLALFVIGAVSVLITLLFTVRERYREFAILKTLGFTPRQVAMSVISGSILLSGIAIIIGLPLGVIFTRLALNYIGIEYGMGTPFGTMPGPLAIAMIIPLILFIATLGSILPAYRVSNLTVSEALRVT